LVPISEQVQDAQQPRRDVCDSNELNGGRDAHDVSQRMAPTTPVTK
jgi:hypothetical protein